MKDTNIRVSARANAIFEEYIYHKKLQGSRMTKRSLLESFANKLAKTKFLDVVKNGKH